MTVDGVGGKVLVWTLGARGWAQVLTCRLGGAHTHVGAQGTFQGRFQGAARKVSTQPQGRPEGA